jgi:hypothetical protein
VALRSKDKALFGGKSKYGADPEDGKRQGPSEKEIDAEVDLLDKDMNELRSQYELYFMGIEKVEPTIQRDGIKATIRKLVGPHIKNTALKFRIQQLKARMISLENYWERTARQREAGTYKRDQARVARREAEIKKQEIAANKQRIPEKGELTSQDLAPTTGGKQLPPDGKVITGAALQAGKSAAETAGRSKGVPPAAAKNETGRPSASSAEDLTEPKLRRLYQTYVNARKRCGEKVDLRYEDMAAALRKQVPKLIKETGARTVEFKVVIRSGRAVLKALPKHEK